MDSSSSSSSPKSRELLGPRPTPLRVRKDSHKVKKPPIVPPSHYPQHNISNTKTSFQQHRTTPLIIYTISPKVIHTNPEDFMTLVQRLTGADDHNYHQLNSTSSHMFDNIHGTTSITTNVGLISPAARYAVMDKINSYQQSVTSGGGGGGGGGSAQDDIIIGSTSVHLERSIGNNMQFVPSGILSPGPASLAPNNFFSPLSSSDQSSMSNFFQGLSPLMNHNNQQVSNNKEMIFNFNGNSNIFQQLIPSPGTNNLLLSPSIISSPTIYSLDLFNNFGDL